MTVVLVSTHRRLISLRDESLVCVDVEELSAEDEFDVIDDGNGAFGLRTLAGKFVSAFPDGRVEANRTWLRDWEKFWVVPAPEGRFGLLTFHRLFISALPSGKLEANRTWLRSWEEFYLHELPTADSLAPGSLRVMQGEQPKLRGASAIFDHCHEHPSQSSAAAMKLFGSYVSAHRGSP